MRGGPRPRRVRPVEAHLRVYPDGPHADDARRALSRAEPQLARLRDQAAWHRVQDRSSRAPGATGRRSQRSRSRAVSSAATSAISRAVNARGSRVGGRGRKSACERAYAPRRGRTRRTSASVPAGLTAPRRRSRTSMIASKAASKVGAENEAPRGRSRGRRRPRRGGQLLGLQSRRAPRDLRDPRRRRRERMPRRHHRVLSRRTDGL